MELKHIYFTYKDDKKCLMNKFFTVYVIHFEHELKKKCKPASKLHRNKYS